MHTSAKFKGRAQKKGDQNKDYEELRGGGEDKGSLISCSMRVAACFIHRLPPFACFGKRVQVGSRHPYIETEKNPS